MSEPHPLVQSQRAQTEKLARALLAREALSRQEVLELLESTGCEKQLASPGAKPEEAGRPNRAVAVAAA